MASITITNLDQSLSDKLRQRAESNGRSIEDEAGDLLAKSLKAPRTGLDIMNNFRDIFAEVQPVELEIPQREPVRPPPEFDE